MPAPASASSAADLLRVSPVMPVVVVTDPRDAVPLARALARGGVGIIEITLRTPSGLGAVERVAAEVPEIVVGAGTVTTPAQVTSVVQAGAQFVVLPGAPEPLLAAALSCRLPVLAGASTVTEMMRLHDHGLSAMKFFPAGAAGGVAFLSAVAGPLPDLLFCPTGGISAANAPDYLALPNVGCVGGSWITPSAVVAARDWGRVQALAREASRLGART